MKKLIIFLFIVSCGTSNINNNKNNIKLNFKDELTFEEFDLLLKKYSEISSYPNINK